MKIKHLLLFLLIFLIMNYRPLAQPVTDDYLSPEHLYVDRINHIMYIGLATYNGVGIYDLENEKVLPLIAMPGPVGAIVVDEKKQVLYAAARGSKAELYVYDLANKSACERVACGYGPADLAIDDLNGRLFVANRFDHDVSVIDMESHEELKRLKADREPVALALSKDSKLLAVANLLPSQASTAAYIASKVSLFDAEKLRLIKEINLPNGAYALKDIVFSPDGRFIYVTHLLGRYNVLTNQIEKGWINTNAVSIIDANTRNHYTTVLLDDIYKGAANPRGMAISEDGRDLLVSTSGSHELFVIDRLAMHQRIERTKGRQLISQSTTVLPMEGREIQLFSTPDKVEPIHVLFEDIPNELSFLAPVRTRIKLSGKGPAYMVCANHSIYIASYFSDGIDIVDFRDGKPESNFIELGTKDIMLSEKRYGEMLFHDADFCFQQWQSCASCHPGNGRVDGLNWDLLNDGIGNPKNTKSLLYTHATPPAMISGIREDAHACVRAGFKYIQFFDAPERNARAVDAYLASLKPVSSPFLEHGELSESAKLGKQVFDREGCNRCHYGPYYTDLQQHEMGTPGKYDKQNIWDTPTLIEIWRTAPYLHDGRCAKLEDVFRVEKHGLTKSLSDDEIDTLTDFLSSF